MKKLLVSIALVGFASVAFAGPAIEDASKTIITDVGCPCFDGKLEIGGFVGGFFPSGDGDNGGKHHYKGGDDHLDDALGGGLILGYWFAPWLGVEYTGAWYGTASEVHNSTLDLVLRWADRHNCWAPYFLVGGGVHANSENVGIFRVGGGVDVRFENWGCVGLFADGIYTWSGDSNEVDDYAIARLGFRIPF